MYSPSFCRIFDSECEGFIKVDLFRLILKEVDEEFTEEELDDIIAEVSNSPAAVGSSHIFTD